MSIKVGTKVSVKGEFGRISGTVIATPVGKNKRMAIVKTDAGFNTTIRIDNRGNVVD
ncbi:hypothetical protein [Intestinibacillus sp. Marseille-P6563]|uniref:hypothetical protein n=1 Tax=Intestinibacillus sp. Marseille-P6563 TaxID=2364792 RepID=UPI0013DF050E|nr:hypothetical protein [Intestinibacillus sp. Marseille-P6563]